MELAKFGFPRAARALEVSPHFEVFTDERKLEYFSMLLEPVAGVEVAGPYPRIAPGELCVVAARVGDDGLKKPGAES